MDQIKTLESIGEKILFYKKKEGNDKIRLVRCPNRRCEHSIVVYVSKTTEYVDCTNCDCRIKLKKKGE